MEYNPLTHLYLDSERETQASDAELAKDLAAMEVAKERAMRCESHYDVVNNQMKVDAPKPVTPPKPATPPPDERRKVDKHEKPRPALPHYYWPGGDRDYHVINNHYKSDHMEKAAADQQNAMETAAERFAKQNHYNIVQGRLYDPSEEQHYREARRHAQATHGMTKQNRLPLTIKTREGAMYDITAPHRVLKRDELFEREQRAMQAIEGDRLKMNYETALAQRSEEERQLAAQRANNRISHQRYVGTVQRGYNILSNQDFKGRTGKPYPAARTRARAENPLQPPLPYSAELYA